MKHICIVGAGTAGSVLAVELLRRKACKITLIDIDSVAERFERERVLKVEIPQDSFIGKLQTVGYGFGGTSNLWHGVLTRLDDEDYDPLGEAGLNLREELRGCELSLERYFGNLGKLDFHPSINKHPLQKYFSLEQFWPKFYTVKFSPTRFRKELRSRFAQIGCEAVNLHQNSVAIQLHNSDGKITGVECSSQGRRFLVEADQYVVCAGALESPRLLMQSFDSTPLDNPLLGKGLMDHPSVVLGELQLPKQILYGHHGRSSLFLPNSQRIGFRIPRDLRRTEAMNHSLFFRPHLDNDVSAVRKNIRALIYRLPGTSIGHLFYNHSMLKAAMTLALEKAGIGYLSRKFLVSAQFEQTSYLGNEVSLRREMDSHGRRIPYVQNRINEIMYAEARHLSSLVSICTRGNASFQPFNFTCEDFEPGSHHSGTCRLGADPTQSVVNMDLRYHGLKNLYVCDASVIPKIGNANLTLTISALATRLASHLSVMAN